jgi:hypothetical protein
MDCNSMFHPKCVVESSAEQCACTGHMLCEGCKIREWRCTYADTPETVVISGSQGETSSGSTILGEDIIQTDGPELFDVIADEEDSFGSDYLGTGGIPPPATATAPAPALGAYSLLSAVVI